MRTIRQPQFGSILDAAIVNPDPEAAKARAPKRQAIQDRDDQWSAARHQQQRKSQWSPTTHNVQWNRQMRENPDSTRRHVGSSWEQQMTEGKRKSSHSEPQPKRQRTSDDRWQASAASQSSWTTSATEPPARTPTDRSPWRAAVNNTSWWETKWNPEHGQYG